jgi:hypothetical protein
MSLINWHEIFVKTINILMPNLVKIFWPILFPVVLGSITLFVIKKVHGRLVYDFSLLSGDSRREANSKVKKANNFIDLISWILNIFGK